MSASATHPAGEFRAKAVKAGFDFSEWLFKRGIRPKAEIVLTGINKFLCEYSKQLNEALYKYATAPPPASKKEIDIMELTDSNLLKQAILKYRREQEKNQTSQQDERNE